MFSLISEHAGLGQVKMESGSCKILVLKNFFLTDQRVMIRLELEVVHLLRMKTCEGF
jgi:hypothetical protein